MFHKKFLLFLCYLLPVIITIDFKQNKDEPINVYIWFKGGEDSG